MKALILNGSPRRKGTTSQLVETAASALSGRGYETQVERVYAMDVKPCLGCLKCRPDGDCALPEDDAHRVARLVGDADLLVLASPVYWGNVTGPMKTLIDRLVPVFEYIDPDTSRIPRKMQKGKEGIIITCSNSPPIYNLLPSQSAGAVRSMKTILRAGGYKIRKVVNIPNSATYSDRSAAVSRRIVRTLG